MNRMSFSLIAFGLFFLSASAEVTLHVDAKAAAGGDGTAAKPYGSVQAAVESLRRTRNGADEAATVRLAAGDYYIATPLELDKRDSGVTFVGEGRVRLLRAEKVTPGGKVDCAAGDPPAAEGFGSVRPHLPLFFYDGKWAVEARWPNEGFATFTEAVDTGLRGRVLNSIAPDNPPVAGSFRFDNDRAATWDYTNGVWLCGYFTHDWSWERIRAAGYDAKRKVMSMAAPATFGICGQSWTSEPARRFCVVGAKSELDAPGEYWYDRTARVVHFIAPEGMREFLAVTRPGWLVTVTDAENVRFRNISFEYALEGAVSAKNCRGLEIADCRIGNVGGDALHVAGGRDCRIVRTTIAGCGNAGVTVSGGDRRKLVPSGHLVADCDISDFGRINRTYSPGVQCWGVGVTLRGNRIHDAPHTGILYGGNNHLFERNEIWNLLYECGDAGAVYTGRDPTSRGNLLRFNYIHDCGHRGRATANMMGFYVDDCDCGDTFVSNRVVNVPRGLLLGGGQDNHIVGNVFERCDIGLSIDNRAIYEKDKWDSPTSPSWQMTRKVKEMHVDEEPWKSRYPLLATYLDGNPREPRHNSIVGNTFRDCNQPIEYWLEGNPRNRDLIEMRDNRFETEKAWRFPRATPESVGIPSASVQKLLDRLEAEGDMVHSYMLIRHGKVVAEGWWAPYDAETRHALFSVSKSFVAMALGFAIEDRKMTINDRVNWFFPECVPTNQDARAKEIRVRDLMAMASGQQHDSFRAINREGPDGGPKAFFRIPMANPPGLLFRYMSGNTAMLAQIHRKVTGVNDLVNYLYPRVFEKLGFGDFYWERQPDGTVLGGSGFELRTEDLAKVCQLLLDGGRWQGERVLPLWWVKQATSCQTPYGQVLDPILAKHVGVKDDAVKADTANDWEVGYGYQLWMGTHETFRLCGAYGQIGVVMPDKDLVFVSNAGGDGANKLSVSAFYDTILPDMKDAPLPENPSAVAALRARSAHLTLNQFRAKVEPTAAAKRTAAKGCRLSANDAEVKGVRFDADRRVVEIENGFGVQRVPVAEEGWAKGWVTVHEHSPETIGRLPGGLQPVAAQGVWYTPDTFGFRLVFTRSPYYIDFELDCGGEEMKVVSYCPLAARYSNVRKRRIREIRLDDYWLNVDCRSNGWDDRTGFRIYIDGREEFRVYEPIGGGRREYAFDVSRFRGKTARVVATALGAWEDVDLKGVSVSSAPASDAVVRTATLGDCAPMDVTCARADGQGFLCVPVRRGAAPVLCTVWDGDKPSFDLRLRVAADGKGDFDASIPIDGFRGGSVRLTTVLPVVLKADREKFAKSVGLAREPRPGDPEIRRPKLHFSAPFGGSGDMVGFFRLGETYHMGYLHDYGYDIWNENCCWGHATSTDFFDWRTAPAYDRKGVGVKRSSGCCFVDERNASGLGDGKTPPVLLFGCVENQYAQRWQRERHDRTKGPEKRPELASEMGLKVSRDGGRTFESVAKPLFTLQAIGGHDPEVVYDAAHGTYVMVVHDRRDGQWGFDFYVSRNLLDWEYASTVPGLWETPNFYPLVCEGKTWWVLQQCLLDYLVGEFDGRVFTPQGKLNASFKGAFAPRTFLTADGRRVLMAARLNAGPTGGATLPMELSLVKTAEGPRLAYRPVREIAKYAAQVSDTTEEFPGDTWEVAGRKGKFLEGEPHVVRTIVDGPVTDYFVGWGVVSGTLPTAK